MGPGGGQAHPVFVQAPQLSLGRGPRFRKAPSLLAGQQLSCTRQTLTSDLSFIALKVKRSNNRTRTYWQLPSVNFTYLQLRNRGAQNRYITVTDPNCYSYITKNKHSSVFYFKTVYMLLDCVMYFTTYIPYICIFSLFWRIKLLACLPLYVKNKVYMQKNFCIKVLNFAPEIH